MSDRSNDSPPRAAAPARTVRIGAIVLSVSLLLIILPFLLGMSRSGKYLVAPAFVGACIGLSILAHGSFDWLRRGKG